MKYVLNQCDINNIIFYKVSKCDFNVYKVKIVFEMKGIFLFLKYSNEKNIYFFQYFFYKEEFKYKKC